MGGDDPCCTNRSARAARCCPLGHATLGEKVIEVGDAGRCRPTLGMTAWPGRVDSYQYRADVGSVPPAGGASRLAAKQATKGQRKGAGHMSDFLAVGR